MPSENTVLKSMRENASGTSLHQFTATVAKKLGVEPAQVEKTLWGRVGRGEFEVKGPMTDMTVHVVNK